MPRAAASAVISLICEASSWLPVLTLARPMPSVTCAPSGAGVLSAHYPTIYDPIVLIHAEALLRSTPEGACAYLDCDMHDTGTILTEASRTLDFSQPVGVMLISILHFVDTLDATRAMVNSLLSAMPAGSGFAISHPASDIDAEQMAEMIRRINQALPDKTTLRSHDEVEQLFDGYELLPPGVVRAAEWRPDAAADTELPSAVWGGVAV